MLTRQERMNMVDFISKTLGFELSKLANMTDEDIEHFYNRAYNNIDHEV